MRGPATALSAAIVAAVVLAGCAGSSAAHVTMTPSKPANQPRMPGLLHRKYQALAIAFPGRDTGIAAIAGYAGESTTVRWWIERTTDGAGRHGVRVRAAGMGVRPRPVLQPQRRCDLAGRTHSVPAHRTGRSGRDLDLGRRIWLHAR